MKRKPIITRIPITTLKEIFQTICSSDPDYNKITVLRTYPSIVVARNHYIEDIQEYKNTGGSNTHFAIRKVSC